MGKHIIETPKQEALRPAFVGFTCSCGQPMAMVTPIDNPCLFQCAACQRQFTISIMMHSIHLLKPVNNTPKDNPNGGPNG